MVPDVLSIHSVHDDYMKEKPKDYNDSLTFIESFNVKQRQKDDKRWKNKRLKGGPMEVEALTEQYDEAKEDTMEHVEDEVDEQQQVEQEMFLLETGQ